ncbi:unnamed protein product [Gongylonema pulchrum]|uniref:Uncharacterized protein n=1 Tax=Gongylonema pulchrum TaxID=637853 RepID=A0A183D7L3_9BILA|nr:unnamed protein product [Gongylonema pulchrum]
MKKTSEKLKLNNAFIKPGAAFENQQIVKPNATLQEKKAIPEQPKPKVFPVTGTTKGPKKERKLIGLIAYGIYRSRSYYSPLERRFRHVNDYDDYLVKIFEDDDYVILTKFMQLDRSFDLVASAPRDSNVLIMNRKHVEGGEDFVDMISMEKLRARAKKLWLEKEKAAYVAAQIQSWRDYPTKKFKDMNFNKF